MYLQHFGLKELPFNITADPAFLYPSRCHREAMAHVWYGIQQRKGFIELTGDVGTGKTTLCRALLRQIDAERINTAFILNSNLSADDLLQAIVEDLGLALPASLSRLEVLRRLNRFLLDQLAIGNNTVVIIDEAQNLGPAELEHIRLLSNLETEKEKLLQVVLVGQPQLRDLLNREELSQLRQRIAVRYHITPLTSDELPTYVQHRLQVAGYGGRALFADEAYQTLFEYSQGVPRVINLLCDKVLLACYAHQLPVVGGDTIQQGIVELEGRTG